MYPYAKASVRLLVRQDRRPLKKRPVRTLEAGEPESDKTRDVACRLLQRVRFKRARNALRRMGRNGYLFRKNATPEQDDDWVYVGGPLVPQFQRSSALFSKSIKNVDDVIASNGALDAQEESFADNFLGMPFYATHATQSRVLSPGGDLVLYSRKRLREKAIAFSEKNSTSLDVNGLGNDDYVFFSLEVGEQPSKDWSRFGSRMYKVKYDHPAFAHSSMSLVDQLELEAPLPGALNLSDQANDILYGRCFDRPDVMFHGRERSIVGLLHSIIHAARELPPADRQIILNARSETEINNIINYIFRPEIRVPGMIAVCQDDFGSYRLKDE
ncbi:hypothetical protein QCE63_20940 [Caballeronia sp. LZ065]|uniref:hypothetical protein n=1 Tax=Caballeronia sp. LZ065 TaxID=3038571 RepID=UPI00285BB7B0|nr:hypothetical protein [Caballeronia sp. LZ065]MDR5781870.1 hypothetical protein [Caballeronia sp. LZ065]